MKVTIIRLTIKDHFYMHFIVILLFSIISAILSICIQRHKQNTLDILPSYISNRRK